MCLHPTDCPAGKAAEIGIRDKPRHLKVALTWSGGENVMEGRGMVGGGRVMEGRGMVGGGRVMDERENDF